ncbi:unnamed protein product [Closterium sp. Yama58-4]|nr:unnamed protein product [Closterium sp. Yama58-4]
MTTSQHISKLSRGYANEHQSDPSRRLSKQADIHSSSAVDSNSSSCFSMPLSHSAAAAGKEWPPFSPSLHLLTACVLALLAAAVANAGGVGGGGLFVPLFNLLLGYDAKSATALSKAMIMGGAIASACFNLPLQHPFHPHLPLIDFRVARLMQPMLLLGISIGITCNVVFPPWLLTAFLTLLLSCMAGKAAQRAVAMMVTEAHMAAVCLHGSYGTHHTTPLSLTIPWLLEAPSSMAHPSLSAASSGALMATHALHQQPLPSPAKATQSFWWPALVRAACASQHLGVSAKAREEKEQENEPLLSASPALEAVAPVPPVSPVSPAPPVSAAALQEPSERGPAAAAPAAAPAIQAPGATLNTADASQQHAGSAITADGTDGTDGFGGSGVGGSGGSRGWWKQKRASGGCAVPLESPVSDACCPGVEQQPGGCCVHAGTCCRRAACEEGYAGSADYGGGESETGKGKRHRTWSAGHVLKPFVFRFACGATSRLSASLLAGCMGGLLGVGGGMVMGPVLLELGMLPQVSSATSSFIVLFSSSLSVLEFYLLGRIPIPPALLFALVAALAALLGLSTIRALVVRSGRTSLIVLFLSVVIAASAVLLGALGVMRVRSDWESGAPMGFRAFCGETW